MKINVSIQQTKNIAWRSSGTWILFAYSRDTQCSCALNSQPPRVIAEHAIRLSSSNGWGEFWPEPIKFLVDMPNHVHWLRMQKQCAPQLIYIHALQSLLFKVGSNVPGFFTGCGVKTHTYPNPAECISTPTEKMYQGMRLHWCHCQFEIVQTKGLFILHRNCVAALHPSACYCDVTALQCCMKVKFILTWNAVKLRWLAAERKSIYRHRNAIAV